MDLWYLLEASFLTHIMKDTSFLNNSVIWVLLFIYGIFKLIPRSILRIIECKVQDFLTSDYYNTSIVIPYHNKVYTSYGNIKPVVKTQYSEKFFAINHHIKKYHINKISSLTEILNFENTKYIDINSTDYLLIPKNKQSILLCKKNDIYLEVIYDIGESNKDDKDDSENSKNYSIKRYVYKLFKPGLNHMQKINIFLENIIKEYMNDTTSESQMVFEYQKSVMDDYNKLMMDFVEAPFYTNKSFDNIFFEKKQEIISYLKLFLNTNNENKEINEKYGIPFKCVFMLHGPPGCGKSSLIKSTIKYTKRHCVLVSWSRIKTCSDFVALFRPIKIDKKVYNQDQLIIVFEDFDANENNVLKKRDEIKSKLLEKINTSNDNTNNIDINDKLESLLKTHIVKNNDEITLEYVLNVLDGIVELNNSIVFFTTNTLEAIDPALTRPGRIDKVIKMDYLNSKMLKEILQHYYKNQSYEKYKTKIKNIENKEISYSRIIQIVVESKNINEFFKNLELIF
jgi:SpoVK/Ycf46/Vps4 family AAA+-type ATPase